jgi:hypothetical protein
MAKAELYGDPRNGGIVYYEDGSIRCMGWQRRIKVLTNTVDHLTVLGLPANGSRNDLNFVKS